MAYLFHNEKVIDWSSWLKNLKPRPLVDHNFYRLWYLVVLVLLQDFMEGKVQAKAIEDFYLEVYLGCYQVMII